MNALSICMYPHLHIPNSSTRSHTVHREMKISLSHAAIFGVLFANPASVTPRNSDIL